jgi:hypothetical protein
MSIGEGEGSQFFRLRSRSRSYCVSSLCMAPSDTYPLESETTFTFWSPSHPILFDSAS